MSNLPVDVPRADVPHVFLQSGHDRRIAEGHPWAYSNEIRMDASAKALAPGTIVVLHRTDGKPLGVGSFNPHTLIAFRLFNRNAYRPIDEAFLQARLARALALRERLFGQPFYRLVHAEADGLPGLICDRFGDVLVLQLNTAGMQALAQPLLSALEHLLAPPTVVLRNDSAARAIEGLVAEVLVAKGKAEEPVELQEGPLKFFADVCAGQKTGWFYDQRDSRRFVARLAAGGTMLDVYCHTGGFALAAAQEGATQVDGVDSSDAALALAHRAALVNGLAARVQFHRADVFEELQRLAVGSRRWRTVVADPPAFVKSRKDLGSGLRGYRKLTRLAASVVEPGGFLFVASCSHNVEAAAFRSEVVRGIAAAGRSGRILRDAGAAADHPIHTHLPESAYLKSLTLQLD
ncbi:MAG: class I SAM-dependent rRNA methyltransferase [Defluviicoccus sp.]|nr:MAG: class I SAM-dependent rRNA methyltransferase [Defluviicoccus sp.]